MTTRPCHRQGNPRRGFALLTALVAILTIAALVTATALRTDEDRRAARATTLHHHALAGAEDALWRTVTTTNAKSLRTNPVGASTTTTTTGDLTQIISVTKLDATLFWIIVHATVHSGPDSASHRIALWARLPADTITSHLIPLASSAWADLY